jgi:hypothetical protein
MVASRLPLSVDLALPCLSSCAKIPKGLLASVDMLQSGFTPDGRFAYAVITEDMSKQSHQREYSLAFWEAATGTPAGRVCPPRGVAYVVWSKDGKTAALVGQKMTWLWQRVALPLK